MNLNDYLNDAIGKRDFASKVGDEFRFLEKDVPIDLTGKVLLRVYQEDSLFGFIQRWLISEGKGRSFEVVPAAVPVDRFWEPSTKPQAKTMFVIGRGLHKFVWDNVEFSLILRTVGEVVGTSRGPAQKEEMLITVQEKDQLSLHEWVEYIYEVSRKRNLENLQIYVWNVRSQFWELIATRAKRPMESVILPDDTKERILEDVEDFYSKDAAQFYYKHGIPYKRSLLLSGPPGTGKTSFITAIASKFNLNVAFLQPAEGGLTDSIFAKSMQRCPKNSVIVLEDVDALFDAGRKKTSDSSALTFSGMLNALDGLTSPSGQLFILTTNHPERLDSAMLRDGRCDLKAHFPHATASQFRNMFRSFYPSDSDKDTNEFVSMLEPLIGKISMAKLQAFFVSNRKRTSAEALANLPAWVTALHDELLDEMKREEESKQQAELEAKSKMEAVEETQKKVESRNLSLSQSH